MSLDVVTGASGFIGSHLVDALRAQGRAVRAVLRPTSSLRWLPSDVEIVRLADWRGHELRAACAGADRLFHVAGVTHAPNEAAFFSFHVGATAALLAAACDTGGISRVVIFSSLAAAGPSRTGQPLREDDPPCPVSWYGRSKLAQEEAVQAFRDRLSIVILRPPAVYGPRDRDFLPLFKAASKGLMPAPRRGTQSLTSVRDIVRGALDAASASVPSGRVYFICSREITTWEGLAQALGDALNRRIRLVRFPRRCIMPIGRVLGWAARVIGAQPPLDRNKLMEARFSHWTCVPRRAERELGFSPSVDLAAGIRETADWYRSQGLL